MLYSQFCRLNHSRQLSLSSCSPQSCSTCIFDVIFTDSSSITPAQTPLQILDSAALSGSADMRATVRCLSELIASTESMTIQSPTRISPSDLPLVLRSFIDRHLRSAPASTSTQTIPNPFVGHRSVTASPPRQHQPYITRRRQKILLQSYPPFTLPPSPTNPISDPPRIAWNDGERELELSWEGDWTPKERKDIYASRRIKFKGTRAEREKPQRMKEIAERMAGMDKRIEEYRKVCFDFLHRHG